MKMRLEKKAIDKIYKRRDRIDMPEYQRQRVWPDKKKRLLIDSIIRGWRMPKFYFVKLDVSSYECVDGQQRLNAIWEFYEDTLELDDDLAGRLGGSKYSELSPDITDAFDDYEIDIEEIEDASEADLEELFKRLQLGMPLNTPEKLNAISGGIRTFAQDVIKHNFFKEKVHLKDTRYAHYDIAVRWLYAESRGIDQRTRLADLESFMRENRTFSKNSTTAKTVLTALDYLNDAFAKASKSTRNKANTLSVCMLAGRVVKQGLSRETATKFGEFAEDFFTKLTKEVEKGARSKDKELLKYQEAIRMGSAEGHSIKIRLDILTNRLSTYDPAFSGLLGAYHEAATSATRGLTQQAEVLSNLIYSVNSKYSATAAAGNGEDLFKLTNKTAKAIQSFSKPTNSQSKFERLIDDLYFLVYEGSGDCKRLPPSNLDFVMDVKHY